MSKEDFAIISGSKKQCKVLLEKYHYLSKESRGFKTKENYILMCKGNAVGVCIFTGFPVIQLFYGMFGLDKHTNQDGFYELSRLCLDPEVQKNEYNLASWFVSRCIKDLRKRMNVRSILSYADSRFHIGKIYQALGFDYCGMTDKRKDFWFELEDGSYKKHSRGKIKGAKGEWRDRSRKYRYVKVYDESLNLKWETLPYMK